MARKLKKPEKGKSLSDLNPELAKQWHPTNNGSFIPCDVLPGSPIKTWWKCPKGEDHEWDAVINMYIRLVPYREIYTKD